MRGCSWSFKYEDCLYFVVQPWREPCCIKRVYPCHRLTLDRASLMAWRHKEEVGW